MKSIAFSPDIAQRRTDRTIYPLYLKKIKLNINDMALLQCILLVFRKNLPSYSPICRRNDPPSLSTSLSRFA